MNKSQNAVIRRLSRQDTLFVIMSADKPSGGPGKAGGSGGVAEEIRRNGNVKSSLSTFPGTWIRTFE